MNREEIKAAVLKKYRIGQKINIKGQAGKAEIIKFNPDTIHKHTCFRQKRFCQRIKTGHH